MLRRARHDKPGGMTFWEHLEELRWVLFKCLFVLLAGTVVGMVHTRHLYRALLYPIRDHLAPLLRAEHFPEHPAMFSAGAAERADASTARTPSLGPPAMESPGIEERLRRQDEAIAALEARLAALGETRGLTAQAGEPLQVFYASPTDPFMIRLKLAFIGGSGLAAPLIAWLVWSFVAPGLRPAERRLVARAAWVGTLLFLVGGAFGYAFLPLAIPALMHFGAPGVAQYWPLNGYIDFCTRLILAFAVAFELPVVLAVLVRMDLIDVRTLQRGRPYALVAILVVAALLTPPDVFSQVLLAVPMIVLYEIGILAGRRRRHPRPDHPQPKPTPQEA